MANEQFPFIRPNMGRPTSQLLLENPVEQKPQPARLDGDEHPMLAIPFSVSMNDRKLEGKTISLAGCHAVGLVDPTLDGSRQLVTLTFGFDGFYTSIPAEMTLLVRESREMGLVEYRFVDPAGAHLPQLRYILNAFVAGDVVAIGSLLAAPKPRAPKDAAREEGGVFRKVSQALRVAAILAATVGLAAIAWTTVDQRVLTMAELRPAIVTVQSETMRAPAGGQIEFVNPNAGEGDVLFSVLSNSGALINIMMPCDCAIPEISAREGATVLAGDPVLRLADPDAPLVVEGVMSYEGIHAALSGDQIELTFPDGRIVDAEISYAAAEEIMTIRPGDFAPVELLTDTSLSENDQGQFVQINIHEALPLFADAGDKIRALFDQTSNF